MIIFAPKLLGISILDAAIMGAVVGAVSPAVIVPKMLKLMEEGYGVRHSIPQLILVGASVDDVFVIVMFTAFTGLAQGNDVSIRRSLFLFFWGLLQEHLLGFCSHTILKKCISEIHQKLLSF